MDILDLERAHETLRSFLEQCVMPCARAMAIARFVQDVPADLQGRGYYLAEVGPWLCEALRDDAFVCWEPEHGQLIAAAVSALERAGVFSAVEASELGRLAVRAGTFHPPRDESPLAAAAQVSVRVPLVCKLPRGPRSPAADEYVGVPAVVTVALRVKEPRDEPITWNNGNALTATSELRAFRDVAADLRVAAREAMHLLAESAGRDREGLGVRAEAFGRIDLERLGFDLSIPEKQMPLAGDSIGLALAAAMAGAMAGALNGECAWRPREDLAWTGSMLPTGEVLQVDRGSLAAKIRVAHAAGLAGVVVPRGMGLLAREIVRRLDWQAEVIEAGSLLEVLGNRDLMQSWRLPASVAGGLRRPVLGRNLLVAAGAVAALALVGFLPRILDEFGAHWYPLWRPFPPLSELRVPALVRPGFTLALPGIRDLEVLPPPGRGFGFAGISDKLAGDLGGRPCLVCGVNQDSEGGHHGFVEVRDLRTGRTLSVRHIEGAGLPFEPRHVLPGVHYDVKAGVLADVDRDGRDEIVISASANPHALTTLQIIDGTEDGHLARTGSLLHNGHLEHLLAHDLDGDGRLEILAAGYHGPSQGMSLLVLRAENFYAPPENSSSAAAGPWSLGEQPCVGHLVIPMLPGYFEVRDVTHLGGFGLGLREAEDSGKLIRVEIGAGSSVASDYLLNIPRDLDVGGVDIIVNQRHADQCRYWVRDGAGTDFSSPAYLERWRAMFRRTRTIQMGWDARLAGNDREPRP